MKPLKPVKLDAMDGHIVLYCKNHYAVDGVKWIEGLYRIHGGFCGFNHMDSPVSPEYVADRLWKILRKCLSDSQMERIQLDVHKRMNWSFGIPDGLKPIEMLIWMYMAEIQALQIREQSEPASPTSDRKIWKTLIGLPRPQKRILKAAVRGNYSYSDFGTLYEKN